jgi:DNA-binding transcriptional LysR family regulator
MRGQITAAARIGAIPTSVPASPLLTMRFLERNPAATVRVEALSSREIARRLADFELDAGLTYLDDETPPHSQRMELYREQYVLIAPSGHAVMDADEVTWAQAATLPLCALTPAMRNRRIIDRNMAAERAQFRPVVEADTVGAIFAHLTTLRFATIASTAWLTAFGVPAGLALRPMAHRGPGPAVGLIVLARDPNSIVAEALLAAAGEANIADVLASNLSKWLTTLSTNVEDNAG